VNVAPHPPSPLPRPLPLRPPSPSPVPFRSQLSPNPALCPLCLTGKPSLSLGMAPASLDLDCSISVLSVPAPAPTRSGWQIQFLVPSPRAPDLHNFGAPITTFRINTCISVASKRLYPPLESTLTKKPGEGGGCPFLSLRSRLYAASRESASLGATSPGCPTRRTYAWVFAFSMGAPQEFLMAAFTDDVEPARLRSAGRLVPRRFPLDFCICPGARRSLSVRRLFCGGLRGRENAERFG